MILYFLHIADYKDKYHNAVIFYTPPNNPNTHQFWDHAPNCQREGKGRKGRGPPRVASHHHVGNPEK